MKNTKYLYSIDPQDLRGKEYTEALKYKKVAGERLYRELFLKHDKTEADHVRMHYIWKAIAHTEKLLEEMED